MKDDSQVAYVPDIEVRIEPIRSSICALLAKDKKERQFYKSLQKSSRSSRLSYLTDVDGPLINEVLNGML